MDESRTTELPLNLKVLTEEANVNILIKIILEFNHDIVELATMKIYRER